MSLCWCWQISVFINFSHCYLEQRALTLGSNTSLSQPCSRLMFYVFILSLYETKPNTFKIFTKKKKIERNNQPSLKLRSHMSTQRKTIFRSIQNLKTKSLRLSNNSLFDLHSSHPGDVLSERKGKELLSFSISFTDNQ